MEFNSKCIERYKTLTKGLTPSVNNFKEVNVLVLGAETSTTKVGVIPKSLKKFVDEEFYAIENAVTASGKSMPECITSADGKNKVALTPELLLSYCEYLLLQRIDWVNNEHPDFRPQDDLIFPALISVIAQNIGVITADREGVILIPVVDAEVRAKIKESISKDQATEISRFLSKSVPGYQGAKGYVKTKDGVAEFMLMSVLEGAIYSTRHDSHPVYSLLADLAGLKCVDSALTPTQKYAESNYLGTLYSQLTSC